MLILTEKIELPRRPQIFNDYVAEDAARKKRANDGRWLNKIRNATAAIVRKQERLRFDR
jgi:hypothetical protein